MPSSTPTVLAADRQLLTALAALLASAAPEEGCALLLGSREGSCWTLTQLWPCRNVWPQPSQRLERFAVDPREQLVAQRWARSRQLVVLGVAHSHPTSAAVPSRTDCELCVPPALLVIRGAAAELRAWWLEAASREAPAAAAPVTVPPRELPWRLLPWRMED